MPIGFAERTPGIHTGYWVDPKAGSETCVVVIDTCEGFNAYIDGKLIGQDLASLDQAGERAIAHLIKHRQRSFLLQAGAAATACFTAIVAAVWIFGVGVASRDNPPASSPVATFGGDIGAGRGLVVSTVSMPKPLPSVVPPLPTRNPTTLELAKTLDGQPVATKPSNWWTWRYWPSGARKRQAKTESEVHGAQGLKVERAANEQSSPKKSLRPTQTSRIPVDSVAEPKLIAITNRESRAGVRARETQFQQETSSIVTNSIKHRSDQLSVASPRRIPSPVASATDLGLDIQVVAKSPERRKPVKAMTLRELLADPPGLAKLPR